MRFLRRRRTGREWGFASAGPSLHRVVGASCALVAGRFTRGRERLHRGGGLADEGHMARTYNRERASRATPIEASQPIRFAGSVLGAKRHVCAFLHSPDEEYRVLLPFIKEGFERGEKAFHIVDPKLRAEHALRLASAGIDVEAAEKSGQFELRNWADAYLRDGHFDQDRMLALIQEVLDGGIEHGFALTQLVAHMESALEDLPGVDDLVEYETRLNYVLPRYKDPVI